MTIEKASILILLSNFILSILFNRIKKKKYKWLLLVATPIIIANLAYWGPNLKNLNDPEYRCWAVPILFFFTSAGYMGVFISAYFKNILRFIRKRSGF